MAAAASAPAASGAGGKPLSQFFITKSDIFFRHACFRPSSIMALTMAAATLLPPFLPFATMWNINSISNSFDSTTLAEATGTPIIRVGFQGSLLTIS